MPTAVRTALCSSRILEYTMGIRNPPKGDIFAPSLMCEPYSAVRFSPAFVTLRGSAGRRMRPSLLFGLSPAEYLRGERRAASHAELCEDALEMIFNRIFGEEQLIRDAAIRMPVEDEHHDVRFSRG